MINKIGLLNEKDRKIKGNEVPIVRDIKKIFVNTKLSHVGIYVMAIFISRSYVMEGIAPFGIALVAAYLLKYGQAFWITLASTIGIITLQGQGNYIYILIMLAVVVIYKITKNEIEYTTLKMAVLASIMTLLVKSTIVFLGDYYLYDIMMNIFESVIVFSLIYIFTHSITISIENINNKVITNEELICGAIMLSLTVSGFGYLTIFGISLKNVVGVLFVILLAYAGGPSLGTTIGVTIGLVSTMDTPNMPLIISVYGLAGLLAGLFKDMGKIGSIIGFIVGMGIMSFYINGFSESIIQFEEIFIGIVLFMIISNIMQKTGNGILGMNNEMVLHDSYKSEIRDNTYKRLIEVSKVFEELSSTFQRVSDKENVIEQSEISEFINTVANDTCKGCSMRKFCWEKDFYTTYRAMFDVVSTIEMKGVVTEKTLPKIVRERCIRSNEIVKKFNDIFDIYKLNYQWENKLIEYRQLMSQQLEGVSNIMDNLANEIHDGISTEKNIEKRILMMLKKSEIPVKEVVLTQSKNDNFEILVEIKSHKSPGSWAESIIPIVSKTIGYDLVLDKFKSNMSDNNKRCVLKLIKANKFRADTKIATADISLGHVSGDNFTFGERQNNYYIALSDGMGRGQKADKESEIAISLLEKFLEAGFNKELAIKMINSILVLKSNDEMSTTIDLSMLDLFNGKAQFIKIGAAPTFIKRKDRVEIINSQSLPLGILKDVDFQVYETQLEDGDFIITMSDGVLDVTSVAEDKETWMANLIKEIDNLNPAVIAKKIIKKSNEASDGSIKDDMTVLVTKIWKGREGK